MRLMIGRWLVKLGLLLCRGRRRPDKRRVVRRGWQDIPAPLVGVVRVPSSPMDLDETAKKVHGERVHVIQAAINDINDLAAISKMTKKWSSDRVSARHAVEWALEELAEAKRQTADKLLELVVKRVGKKE